LLLTSSYPNGNSWSPVGLNTQTIAVSNSGSYSVTYTAANGCQASSLPIQVVVNPNPTAPIVNPAGPLIICADGNIELYSNILGGNTWSPNGETSDTIIVFAAGSYFVTNTVGGCTSQASNIVVVNAGSNPLPPVITQSNDTLFCSLAASYQWFLNGVPIPGATLNVYVPTASGLYTVYITNEFGCGNTGDPYEVDLTNSINETQTQLFEVYPNPANSQINVKADAKLLGSIYTVYDNTGKVVLSGKINSENTVIELGKLSGGIYLFSAGENLQQTFKVIKE
jgi:hypothetical protein